MMCSTSRRHRALDSPVERPSEGPQRGWLCLLIYHRQIRLQLCSAWMAATVASLVGTTISAELYSSRLCGQSPCPACLINFNPGNSDRACCGVVAVVFMQALTFALYLKHAMYLFARQSIGLGCMGFSSSSALGWGTAGVASEERGRVRQRTKSVLQRCPKFKFLVLFGVRSSPCSIQKHCAH
jgi:hypothetical protein